MNALQFLKMLWPSQGYYCLATPFTPTGSPKPVYQHKICETIEDAAAFAEKHKSRDNIFFCVHTLKKPKVWNASKVNKKTGEVGAWEYRTQTNTLAAKAFFFDLDVGETEEGKAQKYTSQREALQGLQSFCKAVQFPRPMVVSSGGGLHVYWVMIEEMESADWKAVAHKLKKLAQHHGLLLDPMRTTDNSSVLRVAGTFNLKNKSNPRPVEVLTETKPISVEAWEKLIDDALIRANVQVTPINATVAASMPIDDDFSNTAKVFDPVSMKSLLGACPQIRRVAKLKGNVPEPEWYAMLSSVRLVENGTFYAHEMSKGHPNYSAGETDTKLQQLVDKDIGPTTCQRWHDLQPAVCEACPFWEKVKAPLAAARRKPADKAIAPLQRQPLSLVSPQAQAQEMIPPPPTDYRITEKGLTVNVLMKNGDEMEVVFYEHPLYPVRRVVNKGMEVEEQVWRVELPRVDPHEFIVMADALYDRKKLAVVLSNNGVYPSPDNMEHLQRYMVAYIAKLQKAVDAESQHNHLGWINDHQDFILPDKILMADGTVKPVSLSKGATRSSQAVKRKGSLERQVELMDFYNHAAYIPQQFYILCGLAAPLFYMTGHHGVVVNASGDPGASKSTSLYTAASFWGQTEMYAINGTNNGATMKGRNERVSTLANLPVCVDEITHMEQKDAVDLAMSITQPGHRIRLGQDGVERAALDSYKATMMLTTANTSLHNILSQRNAGGTAGSMRVFEIVFKPGAVHKKSDADEYLHDLRENYGWIGEVFMAAVVKNREAIHARVRKVMKHIDNVCNITSGERFWSATIAVALVTGQIAKRLGLLPFDVEPIERWLIKRQVPYMRGVVRDEYVSPLAVLADYLEHINSNILIVHSTQQRAGSNISLHTQLPKGALLARLDLEQKLMFVSKADFKNYCSRIGANDRLVLENLHQAKMDASGQMRRIVTDVHTRKVLGSGTDLSKAQSYVFVVDMTHPEIVGHSTLSNMTKEEKP